MAILRSNKIESKGGRKCKRRQRDLQKLHTVSKNVSCASDLALKDLELLIAKFRLKLKKVRKTVRPFRYDLNQIPNDYTVDVTKGFKALDLVDRVPKELQIGGNDQNHPQEKEARRQNGCLRRLYK